MLLAFISLRLTRQHRSAQHVLQCGSWRNTCLWVHQLQAQARVAVADPIARGMRRKSDVQPHIALRGIGHFLIESLVPTALRL